jgi:hypothetical protein
MDSFSFVILALASFRLTHFVLQDVLFESVRNWIWDKFPVESSLLGYLFTCPWCLGFWVSLTVFICYTILPTQTLFAAFVFALSAVVGLLSKFEDSL